MPTVLIAGGTGTIGKRLQELLVQKGYKVIILTRHITKKQDDNSFTAYAKWNIPKGEIDLDAISEADYIINLAGAGVVDQKWTDDRKREIIESRTQSSALIIKALKENQNKVKAVISASASGYYGADNLLSMNDGFTEDDKPANDFLATVCQKWEESIEPVTALGKRLVILRTGIVLSKKGGAFTEFVKPLRFGIASILGNGKQIVSWIHEDDMCNMYIYALEQEQLSGVYNAIAPNPVSNRELILSIARAKSKIFIPMYVPGFVLKIMMGNRSIEILKSAHLSAFKILSEGFHFEFPEINAAAKDLLKK